MNTEDPSFLTTLTLTYPSILSQKVKKKQQKKHDLTLQKPIISAVDPFIQDILFWCLTYRK